MDYNTSTACMKCGEPLAPNSRFCGRCGAPVQNPAPQAPTGSPYPNAGNPNPAPSYGQPAYHQGPQQNAYPSPVPSYNQQGVMSKKEFYNAVASKNTKSTLIILAVLCFFSAAVGLVLLFSYNNLYSILDVLLLTTLGVLLLVLKHWIVSLIIACYAVFGSIITLINGGNFTGILVIIGGVMVTIALKKINKAYADYLISGEVPFPQI